MEEVKGLSTHCNGDNALEYKKRPLISYVITSYNSEKFIKRAIECAFLQTYSPLEIVISDDCSTDGTFDIIKSEVAAYKGPHKIVVNRNAENMGISQHMSKVYIEVASGEYIVAAHADDVSESDRTEKSYEFLSAHPDCTQAAFGCVATDENLKPLPDYLQRDCSVPENRIYSLESGGHVAVGFSTFKREVMTRFGYLNRSCPTEDDIIGYRALLLGNIAFLAEKKILYRKHAQSNSNACFFDKFPLDEIYNQQVADLEVAVNDGLITPDVRDKQKKTLYYNKELRKVYRVFFAKRDLKSLFKLLRFPKLKFRRKLSYIKQYLVYKTHKTK